MLTTKESLLRSVEGLVVAAGLTELVDRELDSPSLSLFAWFAAATTLSTSTSTT